MLILQSLKTDMVGNNYLAKECEDTLVRYLILIYKYLDFTMSMDLMVLLTVEGKKHMQQFAVKQYSIY
jgi:hypothetical protein